MCDFLNLNLCKITGGGIGSLINTVYLGCTAIDFQVYNRYTSEIKYPPVCCWSCTNRGNTLENSPVTGADNLVTLFE